MTKAADFQRFDKRSEEFVPIDCPKPVAATYLERIGERRLRKPTAITTCPVLGPMGPSSTAQGSTSKLESCSIHAAPFFRLSLDTNVRPRHPWRLPN